MKKIFLLSCLLLSFQAWSTEPAITTECSFPTQQNFSLKEFRQSCPDGAAIVEKKYLEIKKEPMPDDTTLRTSSLLQKVTDNKCTWICKTGPSGGRICKWICANQ